MNRRVGGGVGALLHAAGSSRRRQLVGNPEAIESILSRDDRFPAPSRLPVSRSTRRRASTSHAEAGASAPTDEGAGFSEVFLGIENPDPTRAQGDNKKQNLKVDIAETVATIQRSGIEVMAGFIFGSDEDTVDTAEAIASFATQAAIPTAMTGMLTPIPFTPLAERLRAEGRLREAEFSGNNTDDEVQFVPQRMTVEEMQRGYYRILEGLFSAGAMYRRSRALLERLEPHIFHGRNMRRADLLAAVRSVWRQGMARTSRRDYLGLLLNGLRRDMREGREARRAAADIHRKLRSLPAADRRRSARRSATSSLHSSIVRASGDPAEPDRG